MITYNNSAPGDVNNVGLFGATEDTIGAYKQASEYAADAKYWALLAENKFGSIDELIAEVERLFQEGVLMREDIEKLKQDFIEQDARLMQLIAEANSAAANAQNAVNIIDAKIIEVQAQLDILLGMTVTVETLPPGSEATGSFDNQTGEIHLGIPKGLPGKDGSVSDLSTVDFGTPEIDDVGFYVDKDTSTVHKATLSDIANLVPSVRSISLNGGIPKTGVVELVVDKSTVGLENVLDVPSYSKTEVDNKVDDFVKIYKTKADADADAVDRLAGETVMVWNGTSYDFYTVEANKNLTLQSREPRIVTVNSRAPDSLGNIDITIPTGNPSLYLGEILMFPYDPNQNISYPGVLPADGRVVEKSNASDLGTSLVSGQLPVVSETEWQAGAKQYFSWGKLADGVTDANASNFIQIRLPDWSTGEAVRSPDRTTDSGYRGKPLVQNPYVVTVNGVSPNDDGNVSINSSSVGITRYQESPTHTLMRGPISTRAVFMSDTEWGAFNTSTAKPIALNVAYGGTGATTVDAAKVNLSLERFGQRAGETVMLSPDGLKQIGISNNLSGSWGAFDSSGGGRWIPLELGQGGTGANSREGARTNLHLERFEQVTPQVTAMYAGDLKKAVVVDNGGKWGGYNYETQTYIPLTVDCGGTGGATAASARVNLQLDKVRQTATNTTLVSPDNSKAIVVTNSGWGAFNTGNDTPLALGVGYGGTGATDGRVTFARVTASDVRDASVIINSTNFPADRVGGMVLIQATSSTGSAYIYQMRTDGGSAGQITNKLPDTSGVIAVAGTSGREYKKDITPASAEEALDRVNALDLVNFVYKDDDQSRVRFGIIAEDAELVAPQYIKHRDFPVPDSEEVVDRPIVDNNPIVMDLIGCVQALQKQIDDLKSQLSQTKQ